ncbi:MAG: hypothetical protein HOV68_04795 [Streptomycetaceae bacterium]|nr:hypothetical protein [Streptomycetaceae bacterium]
MHVMLNEMRAQHSPGSPPQVDTVDIWHIVHDGQLTALCGVELRSDAVTGKIDDWGNVPQPCCTHCNAAYSEAI